MTKKLLVILLIFCCSLTFGQTIKTDVLVIGGSASGAAAAIQSARSKVKTILAAQGPVVGDFRVSGTFTINTDRKNPSGIWAEFRSRIREAYKKTPGYDTVSNAPLKFEADTASVILRNIADSVKGLTIYTNASFAAVKKDGDKWEVNIIRDEKTIKIIAKVVVDATENGDVAIKAGAQFSAGFDVVKNNGGLNLYRTSIACGTTFPGQANNANFPKNNYPGYPAYCIPLNAMLARGADNILVTEKAITGSKDILYLPLQLSLGQGVGAAAAYCAFFKTTTQNLRVRTIQGELLDFKGYLLPFADVSQKDPYWRAIQQVSATGLLKGAQRVSGKDAEFLFMPDSLVATAEIQPVLTEIYTRAFLWFGKEKPGDKFTLGNLLSFISDYTLTDPTVLKARIQRDWKSLYTFTPFFDLKHQVTRREFSILANKYLNPFARTIDLNGSMLN